MNNLRNFYLPLWVAMVLLTSACSNSPAGTTLTWNPAGETPAMLTGVAPQRAAADLLPQQAALPQAGTVARIASVSPQPVTPVNAGYGLQLAPLHYIDVADMQRILAHISPESSVAHAGYSRNAIVIAGTGGERAALLRMIGSFDVDWLAGKSFAFFPVRDSDAKIVTREIWDVLGTPGGPFGKFIRIVPFDNSNSILVVSSQSRYVKGIGAWIQKLDVKKDSNDRKIWVYRVKNGRAADLNEPLQKIIAEQSGQSAGIVPDLPVMSRAPSPNQPFSETGDIPPPPTPAAIVRQMNDLTSQNSPRAIADETTNSIIVWANKVEYVLIRGAIQKLDAGPARIRFDAVIAEVTLANGLTNGVEDYLRSHDAGAIVSAMESPSAVNPQVSAFVLAPQPADIINQLYGITAVKILSSPQFTARNNQTAEIHVGAILKAVPHMKDGMVVMDISQDLNGSHVIANAIPVRDGETVALGGIVRDKVTETKNTVPVLEDIPYVGDALTDTAKIVTRTETVVFLTPHIVKGDDDTYAASDETRLQMSEVAPLDIVPHP